MFTLIWVWINGWVNNREAGYLRRYRGHYDVIVMSNDFRQSLRAYSRLFYGYFLLSLSRLDVPGSTGYDITMTS